MQDNMNRRDAKVFRAHAALQGMCDNLINAQKRLANQQKDRDCPVKMVVPGSLEKIRFGIIDGLVAVDNYAAVKIGDLEKQSLRE